jgi:DNA polymerase I-like protein with 3'-5' exonuclease and polymerase domains
MKRFDSIGLFWQDVPVKTARGERRAREMPPIPETGWRPPKYFPNLSAAQCISFDVETYDPELIDHGPGWARGKGHIAGFSVAVDASNRWYFPIRHEVEKDYNLSPEHCLNWLRDTLSNPNQPKIGANLIYDVGWLRQEGIRVAGELIDVQFGEALLDDRARVNLEDLANKYLGVGKTTDLLYKWIMDYYAPPKDKWRKDIYRAPPRLVGPYGEADADLPLRIAPLMYRRLREEGLLDLFQMECGLINFLIEMRFAGVSVDIDAASKLAENLGKRAVDKRKELSTLAGFEINPNASDSIAKAFDKFGIPYPRTKGTKKAPKGKPSFRKEFLETVDHPIGNTIREIRRLEKLKGTFVEGYILNGHVNGKIYGSFHPLRGEAGGTIVGRFSSSNPNLTNIPVRDPELGKPIRGIFVPDPGHKQWRKYDYSQIQFRYLVHYAVGPGSDEARARYNSNPKTDYHAMVKAMVEQATGREWDRRPIKNLNFGLAFGMGNEKAGASTNLQGEELRQFLAAYHKGVPFSKETMKHIMKLADMTGSISTILGRKSRFDLWEPQRDWEQWEDDKKNNREPPPALPYDRAIVEYGRVQRAYLHTALARRLQGSEGDTIKSFLYKCWNEGVFDYIGVPRLLVHDEVDFSDPGGKEDAWEYMKHVMETAVKASVPILAEGDIGKDWGHTEPIES